MRTFAATRFKLVAVRIEEQIEQCVHQREKPKDDLEVDDVTSQNLDYAGAQSLTAIWENKRLEEENRMLKAELESIRAQLDNERSRRTTLETQFRAQRQQSSQAKFDSDTRLAQISEHTARCEVELASHQRHNAEVSSNIDVFGGC